MGVNFEKESRMLFSGILVLSLLSFSLSTDSVAVGRDSGASSHTASDKCGCIIGSRLQFSLCES